MPHRARVAERAEKWVRGFLRHRSPAEHPRLMRAGVRAGHSEGALREAIKLSGARVERRGPNLPALVHSPVINGLEATTPAAPSPQGSRKPYGPPRMRDHSLSWEWGRLEGMAIVADTLMGDGSTTLYDQVINVRRYAEEEGADDESDEEGAPA